MLCWHNERSQAQCLYKFLINRKKKFLYILPSLVEFYEGKNVETRRKWELGHRRKERVLNTNNSCVSKRGKITKLSQTNIKASLISHSCMKSCD